VMDVAQLQECQELDKFLNFVEDGLDYFEYEQGINPNIVVVGRLNNARPVLLVLVSLSLMLLSRVIVFLFILLHPLVFPVTTNQL